MFKNKTELNFDNLINNGLTGDEIDLMCTFFLVDRLKDDLPFSNVLLNNYEHFKYMTKFANDVHVLASGNEFFFIAFYNDKENFPVARSYYYKVSSIFDANDIYKDLNLDNPLKMEEKTYRDHLNEYGIFLLKEGDYKTRIKKFLDKYESKHKHFKDFFNGRQKNTNTDSCIRIDTENCIFCKEEKKFTVSTTIFADKGIFFNYDVCKTCFNDMKNNDISPINYFSKKFTGIDFCSFSKISRKEVLSITRDFLKDELNCEIIRNNKKDKLRGKRKETGFIITFRLTAELDYAYVINNPEKKEVAKIDSRDHHPELKYGPDHLHDSSSKKKYNKEVKDSFTTGTPFIDKKAIINILIQKEKEYKDKKGI